MDNTICWNNGVLVTRAQLIEIMAGYDIPEHCRGGLAGYLRIKNTLVEILKERSKQ
jgi:hypothetical protein